MINLSSLRDNLGILKWLLSKLCKTLCFKTRRTCSAANAWQDILMRSNLRLSITGKMYIVYIYEIDSIYDYHWHFQVNPISCIKFWRREWQWQVHTPTKDSFHQNFVKRGKNNFRLSWSGKYSVTRENGWSEIVKVRERIWSSSDPWYYRLFSFTRKRNRKL